MTAATAPKNLAKRLLAVMASIDAVAKSKHNDAQNYDYVTAADVARAVRQACIAEGVMILVSSSEPQVLAPIPTQRGGQMNVSRITLNITAINVDDPEDMLSFSIVGDGADTGDKGIYKAITGALKYGLRNLFLIPDSADPEGPSGEQPAGELQPAALPPGFAEWAAKRSATPTTPEEIAADTAARQIIESGDRAAAQALVDAVFADQVLPDPVEKPKRTRAKAKTSPVKPIEGEQTTAGLVSVSVGDFLLASAEKKGLIHARAREAGLDDASLKVLSVAVTHKDTSKEWTDADADQIIALLSNEAAVAIFASMKGAAT